MTCEG
jgi:hypothetical protein